MTRSPRWAGFRSLLCPIDFSEHSRLALRYAEAIALRGNAALLLAHVVHDIAAPVWLKADLSAHDQRRVAQAQQRLDLLAARVQKRVKTDVRVVCGRIADEIAALAATERAGLVITALRDRRSWFGARRGSTSYHVLSHAVTPVLAVPLNWRRR